MSEEQKKKVKENKRVVQEGLDRRKAERLDEELEAQQDRDLNEIFGKDGRAIDPAAHKKSSENPDTTQMDSQKAAKCCDKPAQNRTAVRSANKCDSRAKGIVKKILVPAAVCMALAAFQYFDLDRLTSVRVVMFLCAIAIAFNTGRLFECRAQNK